MTPGRETVRLMSALGTGDWLGHAMEPNLGQAGERLTFPPSPAKIIHQYWCYVQYIDKASAAQATGKRRAARSEDDGNPYARTRPRDDALKQLPAHLPSNDEAHKP